MSILADLLIHRQQNSTDWISDHS